jgi:hypothetical protein
MHAGVSVLSNADAARDLARSLAPPRRYLAVLAVPAYGTIDYGRTGRKDYHCTLWGTPEELMACIVSGIDVETGAALSTETQGAG